MPPVGFTLWAAFTQDADERRLASALLALPVLVGVAVAVASRWRWGAPVGRGVRGTGEARGAVALAILPVGIVLLVAGVAPSGFSPTATWRKPVHGSTEWEDVLAGEHARNASEVACARAHAADLARGAPERSRVEDGIGGVRGVRIRAQP
jgi:hypothetical protein